MGLDVGRGAGDAHAHMPTGYAHLANRVSACTQLGERILFLVFVGGVGGWVGWGAPAAGGSGAGGGAGSGRG